MNISVCGINCESCEAGKENSCSGCRSCKGNPFWGECEIYTCASGRELLHCGYCTDFPCDMLTEALERENSDGVDVLKGLMQTGSQVQSRCGLLCSACGFRDTCGCGGCIETNGHPFHGECTIAVCCQGKGYVHCGLCPDMPCEKLYAYSCLDKEHGDNPPGARLGVLRFWAGQ